jgi:hypothetical protein
MWYCLALTEVFCFFASPTHVMYMGDRFYLFELLIARLYADFFFPLSFCDKKKREKVLVSFFVINVFDKESSIFLID